MAEKVLNGGHERNVRGEGGSQGRLRGGKTKDAMDTKPLKLVVKRRSGVGGETPVKERLSWFMSSTESLEAGSVDTLKTGLEKKRKGGGEGKGCEGFFEMESNFQNDVLSSQELNRQLNASPSANKDLLLLRIPTTSSASSMGFNIRGGSEYGLGIFVSRLDKDGVGHRNGLRVGDQIVAVQGKSTEYASHAFAVQVSRCNIESKSAKMVTHPPTAIVRRCPH